MTHRGDGEAGFTLVESLVAFTLLSLALAGLAQTLGGGWRGWQHADSETHAVRLAKSRLAVTGIESPLAAGTEDGESGGLTWRVEVRRHDKPLDEPRPVLEVRRSSSQEARAQSSLEAYWVSVEVTWPDGPLATPRSLTLATLKLKDRP